MIGVLTTHTHTKGHKETCGRGDGYVYYFVVMVSQVDTCVYVQFIKLYALSVCLH